MSAVLGGVVYGAIELRQLRQEREATFELMRTIQTPQFGAPLQWLVERLQDRYRGQPELPSAPRAHRDWTPPE